MTFLAPCCRISGHKTTHYTSQKKSFPCTLQCVYTTWPAEASWDNSKHNSVKLWPQHICMIWLKNKNREIIQNACFVWMLLLAVSL